jgi:dipeptidyl aminopeptidase/acylaminoacyl peptidase
MSTLYVFALPDGRRAFSVDLLPDGYDFADFDSPLRLETFFRGGMPMSWSPDGSRLLYSTAAPPSDDGFGRLVLFDATSETAIDLEDTPGTAYNVRWSPDGQYAFYRGISNFGTGAGASSSGAWTLGPDNTLNRLPVETMLGYEVNPRAVGDLEPIGWLSDTEFVYSDFDIGTGGAGLFVYDAAANSILSLLPIVQYNVIPYRSDVAPESRGIVVYLTDYGDIETQFPEYAEYMLPAGYYYYSSPEADPVRMDIPDESEGGPALLRFADDTRIALTIRVGSAWVDYLYDIETEALTRIELADRGTAVYGNGIISTVFDNTLTLYDVVSGERIPLLPNLQGELRWLDDRWFAALSGDASTIYMGNRNDGIQGTVFEGEGVTVLAVSAVR